MCIFSITDTLYMDLSSTTKKVKNNYDNICPFQEYEDSKSHLQKHLFSYMELKAFEKK